MDREKLKGVILIIISAFGYAIMPSVSTLAYERGLNVSQVLLYRFVISAIFVWAVIWLQKIPFKTSFKHGVYLLTIGFVGYTLCSKVLFMGYQYVSGSVATMILFTHPILVVLGEATMERRFPSRNKLIAIVLALVGLGIIVYETGMKYSTYGLILCFLSSLTYAIYCLGLSEPHTRKMNSLAVTAYVTTLSAVFNLIECLQNGTPLVLSDTNSIGLLVLLAIGGTVIPAIAFFSGLKIVGSGAATIISTVEAAFVYLLEVLVLGQTIIFKNVLGGLLIALAVILLTERGTAKSSV